MPRCPAPRQSGCRSSLRRAPIRPPSAGCGPSSAAGRNACPCGSTRRVGRAAALNRTTYFLTAISFPTTHDLHRCLAATEIQKLPSFSMTGATSGVMLCPATAANHSGQFHVTQAEQKATANSYVCSLCQSPTNICTDDRVLQAEELLGSDLTSLGLRYQNWLGSPNRRRGGQVELDRSHERASSLAAGNTRRYSAKRLSVGCGVRTCRLDDRVASACGRWLGNDCSRSCQPTSGFDPRILPQVRMLPRPFVAFPGSGCREQAAREARSP